MIAKARATYFQLANAYDQLEINSKNLTSLKQIADISRSRYETGLESAANVLVAETDYSKLQEARRDLERNLSDAQSQLNTLMNRDAFAPLGAPAAAALTTRICPPSRLRSITLAQRPEVQMARAKIDGEKSKLQLAQRAWIPDPALMVKGQRYNDAAQAVSELDAGVSFTVPWVNPGKYSAGVREARANLAAAEQGLEREQKEALRLLRDQLAKIETFHHHVELFRDKLVPQAQQAFEATRLSYESGKATFLDWISAQRNLRDIEAMGREHLADYQVAVAELEAVVGAEIYSPGASVIERRGNQDEAFAQKHCALGRARCASFWRYIVLEEKRPGKPSNVDYWTCTMHPSVHAKRTLGNVRSARWISCR